MQGCVRKRDAILIEVVAYANLATEGITTRVKIDFVILVITSLYQDGHVQIGITDGIDDTNFETEVRQRHDDTINLVAILTKLLTDLQSVLTCLNARTARGRSVFRQNDVFVTTLVQRLQQLFTNILCQFRVKIGARSDYHAKTCLSVSHINYVLVILSTD